MSWQKKWGFIKRKQIPNKEKRKPTISFRSDLTPEVLGYIRDLVDNKEKSRYINDAIQEKYFRENNKVAFLRQQIIYNFNLVKYLVRKIGNEFKTGRI